MSKKLFIAEKPSVAQEFAKALHLDFKRKDGYLEADDAIVTWCVGHLVTMSYPEVYDMALKRWSLDTLPFLPKEYKYEVIPAVAKQFNVVKELLRRNDVACIYVCTDSGREGEYIYRLVDEMANVPAEKEKRRVWIDSQTEEEILRGIKEAKPLSEYNALSDAAYLRAKEDYLMGINFSRVLTLKYGDAVKRFLQSEKSQAISVGRVMTCVLGMVVRREREIRTFVKTPFYRVLVKVNAKESFEAEFRAVEGSDYFQSPKLYKENGFKEKEDAKKLVLSLNVEQAIPNVCFTEEKLTENMKMLQKETAEHLSTELAQNNNQTIQGENCSTEITLNNKIIREEKTEKPFTEFMENNKIILGQEAVEGLMAQLESIERKKENKYAPLLFNLAELQNECSRLFKISPDETLKIAQDLYEKKLVTYPRTDARVLSTAVAKEIYKNIGGLRNFTPIGSFAAEVMEKKSYQNLKSTRYVNDKQITDHYAIIPTGQGLSALAGMPVLAGKVYEVIARRFLSIFYPPAVYQKISVVVKIQKERFFANFKVLLDEGYLKVAGKGKVSEEDGEQFGQTFFDMWKNIKKGAFLPVEQFAIKEGETSPPKRYNSGSLILAMENAGQLIEDEELRAQIKGSGIGTSATRAEILNKLVKINYLSLNKKTQVTTPSLLGELIFDVVDSSIRSLLNPELTASWEKGLTYVAEGTIGKEEYMMKLEGFVARLTNGVKGLQNQGQLQVKFNQTKEFYERLKN